MTRKIFIALVVMGIIGIFLGVNITKHRENKKEKEVAEKQIPIDVKVTTPAPQSVPEEEEEKWATVRVTSAQGSWVTKSEINFGADVTTVNLDNDKRVWIGSNFTAEEL
jgi:regulatory protein YycI of two-component signal transduction system YycFG